MYFELEMFESKLQSNLILIKWTKAKVCYLNMFILILFLNLFTASNTLAGERFISNFPCKDSRKNCLDTKGRWVEGVYASPKCWEFEYIKTCSYPSLDNCAGLSHCYFVQLLECLLKDHYGACVNRKKEFSCKRWVAETVKEQNVRTDLVEKDGQDGLICKGIPCFDGNCVDKHYITNGEMPDSIAKLHTASKLKAGSDPNFKLFTGTNLHCTKKATSYSNCCTESLPGWGRNLGANCSQDERTLIENRKKNLCVYVGKQHRQLLSVSTIVKHQYCCFGNMLDKVIQVEGRKQLNNKADNNFGTGSSPDCRGLTVQEIQRIDFSKLDFSEFIEDFKVKFFGKYKKPNSGDIQTRISGSLSNIRRYDDNPRNKENNLTGWNLNIKDEVSEEEERRLELERLERERRRLEEEARKLDEERRMREEEERRRLEEERRRKAIAKEKLEQELLQFEQIKKWAESYVEGHAKWFLYESRKANFITQKWFEQSEGEIKKIWNDNKYNPDFCNPKNDSDFWKIPINGHFKEFFNNYQVQDWCRKLPEILKIQNDLNTGNY